MTVTVELPADVEERFCAQARSRGLSIDAYVKELLAEFIRSSSRPALSAAEVNRLLDEAADMVPNGPSLSDDAMSRESIYTREDEW